MTYIWYIFNYLLPGTSPDLLIFLHMPTYKAHIRHLSPWFSPFSLFFSPSIYFFLFFLFFSICSHFLLPVIYLLFSLSLLIPLPPPPPHLLSCPSNLGSAHCRIRCIGLARPQGPSLSPFYNSFYDLVFLCDLNYHAFKWLGRQRVALLICYLSFCSFCRLDEWSDTPRL